MDSPYLTIKQAAERAQVSRSTVKKWIKEGCPFLVMGPKLKRIRVGAFDWWVHQKFAGTASSQVELLSDTAYQHLIEKTIGVRR